MTVVPLAQYLEVFDAQQPATVPCGDEDTFTSVHGTGVVTPSRDELYQQGLDAGRAEIELEMGVKLAAMEREFSERLEQAKSDWEAEFSEELSHSLAHALGVLQTSISDTVARVLTPFLAEQKQAEALTELQRALSELIKNRNSARIEISGPVALLNGLRHHLPQYEELIQYDVTDGAEVRVVVDKTVLETRLQEWAGMLDEVTS